MFTWSQAEGRLFDDAGTLVATGYAGNGAGLNNPAMQDAENVGPLPCGYYTIGPLIPFHDTVGADVMALTPDPENEMFGRKDFFMHGVNPEDNHSASEGCPVVPIRAERIAVSQSTDKRLLVIATTQGGTE
jgi:hypothetical protein